MATHVADIVNAGSIESALRQAATLGMVVDANFSTNLATTLANIAARQINVGILAGRNPDLYDMYQGLIKAVTLGYNLLGSTVMNGGSLQTIYDAGDALTYSPGFAVTG